MGVLERDQKYRELQYAIDPRVSSAVIRIVEENPGNYREGVIGRDQKYRETCRR